MLGAPPSPPWDQLTLLIELIPDGVLVVGRDGIVVGANAAMLALCGWSRDGLLGQPLAVLLPPDKRGVHGGHMQRFFDLPSNRPMGRVPRLTLWHRAQREVPVDVSLGLLRRDDTPLALAVLHDLTELQAMHERARYLAMHDELTGLYNRHMFGELLSHAVEHAQRGAAGAALLLIDLDDFKSVNDGHGHLVGDALLREVARRMRGALRNGDTLARLGGDEFAVLLREQADLDQVGAVAEKLLEVIGTPWTQGHHETRPSASIGVVVSPADGRDASTLMRHADMAMYRAKELGRGTWALFDAQMARQMDEKALLQGRLTRAIERDQLALHYQPQFDARDGRPVGVEALLRWRDAELGEIPPVRFIAVAESTGLIGRLGDWVLDAACRQIAVWQAQGLALRVAVNVSPHQLRHPGFADRVRQALARWQVSAGLLEIEITETAAMTHHEQSQSLLAQLAALGVHLALDDFGMGHSSLGHLRELPVSRLKMDRRFIRHVTEDEGDAILVRAIIGLAHTMGKSVVAEGVETDAQCRFLQAEGCDVLQGWLFAPALPADAVPAALARLAAQPWRAGPPDAALAV